MDEPSRRRNMERLAAFTRAARAGSFLLSLGASNDHSLLGSEEPTLLEMSGNPTAIAEHQSPRVSPAEVSS
jgi:hypothetical protein